MFSKYIRRRTAGGGGEYLVNVMDESFVMVVEEWKLVLKFMTHGLS